MTAGKTANSYLYYLPYLLLLLLGVYARVQIPNLALLHGDSCNYLLPPYIKLILNEWHKGERPMPYLRFLYYTISPESGLNYAIFWQKILGLTGSVFLVLAWIKVVSSINRNLFIWHLAGYALTAIYTLLPIQMYYEQLIAPELLGMTVLCLLLLCYAHLFYSNSDSSSLPWVLGLSIFVNLFMAGPMPKFMLMTIVGEVLLLFWIGKWLKRSIRTKLLVLAVPHLVWLVFIWIPEFTNEVDNPIDDRTFIEYKQVTFTHFDILIADKTNFDVPLAIQDSLVHYFEESKKTAPLFLTGFSSDDLMWGKANEIIGQYLNDDHTALHTFYRNLVLKLVTKYPFQMTYHVLRHLWAFYIPTRYFYIETYFAQDYMPVFDISGEHYKRFKDKLFLSVDMFNRGKMCERALTQNIPVLTSLLEKNDTAAVMQYFIQYTNDICKKNTPDTSLYSHPPPQANWHFEHFPFKLIASFKYMRWFQLSFLLYVFILALYYWKKRELFGNPFLLWIHATLFIYVITIGIAHTFDITRFISSAFPLMLFSVFLALAYVASMLVNEFFQTNLGKKFDPYFSFLK